MMLAPAEGERVRLLIRVFYDYFRLMFAFGDVVDFVAVAPPTFTAFHKKSTSGLQLAQQQSLRITAFQQTSPGIEIWFGTRGSEVQILSPRPF